MEKLAEVEAAKALMTEAVTWSVMKWLREKKRVRKTADLANAALDHLRQSVINRWPENLRTAYDALLRNPRRGKSPNLPDKPSGSATTLTKFQEADDEAYRARADAEATFDEAEKQLSTLLARDGCKKAIHAWELLEKAIQKAEVVTNSDSDRDSSRRTP